MPSILEAATRAGATHAELYAAPAADGRGGLFEEWLDRHRPAAKEKILGRIRSARDGQLNDSRFGSPDARRGTDRRPDPSGLPRQLSPARAEPAALASLCRGVPVSEAFLVKSSSCGFSSELSNARSLRARPDFW